MHKLRNKNFCILLLSSLLSFVYFFGTWEKWGKFPMLQNYVQRQANDSCVKTRDTAKCTSPPMQSSPRSMTEEYDFRCLEISLIVMVLLFSPSSFFRSGLEVAEGCSTNNPLISYSTVLELAKTNFYHNFEKTNHPGVSIGPFKISPKPAMQICSEISLKKHRSYTE